MVVLCIIAVHIDQVNAALFLTSYSFFRSFVSVIFIKTKKNLDFPKLLLTSTKSARCILCHGTYMIIQNMLRTNEGK